MTDRPHLTIDPAVNSGAPSVRGVCAWVLAGAVWAGEPVDEVAELYEVTREEVLTACWWLGSGGVEFAAGRRSPRWVHRWGAWAGDAGWKIWRGDWAAVTDPPTCEDA